MIVNASKTIKFHTTLHTAVLPLFPNHLLCPVEALPHFLALAGPRPLSSQLFAFLQNQTLSCPSAASVRAWLSHHLTTLQLSTQLYSTHRLRLGGAAWLMSSSVPFHQTKILGDWISECALRYTESSSAQRLLLMLPAPSQSVINYNLNHLLQNKTKSKKKETSHTFSFLIHSLSFIWMDSSTVKHTCYSTEFQTDFNQCSLSTYNSKGHYGPLSKFFFFWRGVNL